MNEKDYIPLRMDGNGVTNEFAYGWKTLKEADLIIQIENINGEIKTLNLGSDYDVNIENMGGNVICKNALTADEKIIISRKTSLYQSKGYSTSPGFQSSAIEKSFDQISCNLQEMDYNIETFKTDFSAEVNQNIDDYKTATDNLINEFKQDTNEQILNFQSETDSKITQVDDAVKQLNRLDEIVEECEQSANKAEDQSNIAQSQAEQATSKADEAITTVNNALTNIQNAADFATQKLKGLYYPVFCFNSGLVNDMGEAALCSIENDILTQHAPCVCTTSDGQTFIINENVTLDISNLEDGDYNVFYFPETKEMKAYKNNIYIQNSKPDLQENDIWVDTSVMPYVTYQGVVDNENPEGIILSQIVKCTPNAHLTRVSGKGSLSTLPYNSTAPVRKSGDTMTGGLTIDFTNNNSWSLLTLISDGNNYSIIRNINPAADLTDETAPAEQVNYGCWNSVDKNGNIAGEILTKHRTNNEIQTVIRAKKIINGAGKVAEMGVGITGEGTMYAFAPTPVTTDNSTKIATTQFCDGQWTTKALTIVEGAISANATKTYSLSSYLPNDGRVYEVIFGATMGFVSESGYAFIYAKTDKITTNVPILRNRDKYAATSFILPVGTNRSVSLYSNSSQTGTVSIALYARGYRRAR